jgi:hypothetical protein
LEVREPQQGQPSLTLALGRFMRISLLIAPLLFVLGCSRPDGREFDAFLTSNRVDRIEIVDEEHDRTNILAGDAVARLLSRFAANNRMADPLHQKSYASGYVWLCSGDQRIGALAYFPREQILSYRSYEFSFRDTNDIASLFR